MKTGTVTKVDFTSGGAGNQWTTIDGVRYATFWDIRSTDWSCGDVVTFETSMQSLWTGSSPILHAHNIHKVNP